MDINETINARNWDLLFDAIEKTSVQASMACAEVLYSVVMEVRIERSAQICIVLLISSFKLKALSLKLGLVAAALFNRCPGKLKL